MQHVETSFYREAELEQHRVIYNGQAIPFKLYRKKVKNINLRIGSELTVAVSAPNRVPLQIIESFVLEKAPWIIKKLERFRQIHGSQLKREFISGEIIYFKGQALILQLLETGDEAVCLQDGKIVIAAKPGSTANERKDLFLNWLKREALLCSQQSLDRLYPLVEIFNIPRPEIVVKAMKSRWGSCSWQKGKISLSAFLMHYPQECIDYVLLHELVHFKYHSHDQSFYQFLEKLMPDWREKKRKLKEDLSISAG